jgi:hypothetical protein
MQNEASTLANGNKQMKESIQFMIQHQEMQKGMFSLINFTYYALYFIISVSFKLCTVLKKNNNCIDFNDKFNLSFWL